MAFVAGSVVVDVLGRITGTEVMLGTSGVIFSVAEGGVGTSVVVVSGTEVGLVTSAVVASATVVISGTITIISSAQHSPS